MRLAFSQSWKIIFFSLSKFYFKVSASNTASVCKLSCLQIQCERTICKDCHQNYVNVVPHVSPDMSVSVRFNHSSSSPARTPTSSLKGPCMATEPRLFNYCNSVTQILKQLILCSGISHHRNYGWNNPYEFIVWAANSVSFKSSSQGLWSGCGNIHGHWVVKMMITKLKSTPNPTTVQLD